MSTEVPTEAEVVAALARSATQPVPLDPSVLYSVTEADGTRRVLSLERYRSGPERHTGSTNLTQASSLHAYVKEHKAHTTARAYASHESSSIVVVLNDHDMTPEWGDWRVTLGLRPSLGWTRWFEHDGELMRQEEFAEHIEDGLLEVVSPSGARMLEIAQSFHANTRATIDSAVRLDNGETQLSYVEQVHARAGQKKHIAIPQTFELGLAPYEGGASYKVKARFRYRLRDAELRLGYKLERPEDVRVEAFDEIAAFFAQDTLTPLFYGTPRPLPAGR